jgi:site-specific DNA-methyltransferase (adenine-specific)
MQPNTSGMSRRPPNNMEPLPTDFALESPVTPASVTSKGVGSGPWLGGLEATCEDCMALMARYPDKHFDLAIVDPPYGVGICSGGGTVGKYGTQHAAKEWDSAIPPMEYFAELRRVSRDQVIWGGNYFPLPPSRCFLIWDKVQPAPTFAQAEFAWTSFTDGARIFKYAFNVERNKIHPTQKPVALYRWLLENYAKPGMKLLDTHLGSGSHAIAAHYFGAHLTACEIDPDYYAAAMARIKRETAQMTLFT